MGVSCMATNCVCSYCFEEEIDQFQGNIIFKPIITNLISENDNPSEEERAFLVECENALKKAEERRANIADKFRDMLDKTGAGVLFNPTFERAIISFIIYLFEQIIISANFAFEEKDFSISNLISISRENKYFIEFNSGFIDYLKNQFHLGLDNINKIIEIQNSITNFVSTLYGIENIIKEQSEIIKKHIFKFQNFSKNISLVTKLKDSSDGIKFIINFLGEITSNLNKVAKQLSNPKKIALYFKIARDAAEKGIKDPKELVIAYSLGVNCGDPQRWEENMIYKDVLKY